MKKLSVAILLLATSLVADSASYYLLPAKPKMDKKGAAQGGAHHGGGESKKQMFTMMGYDLKNPMSAAYHLANLEKKEPEISQQDVILPKSRFGSYQALVAQVETPTELFEAVYYVYKHGMPSRVSPEKLTSMAKAMFEFMPNRLPREHDRYTGSKTYRFDLHFDGAPLADQAVTFETLNGTKQNYKTDKYGIVKVTLPDDFKAVSDNRRANKPSHFVLTAVVEKEGKTYHTTLSQPYYVNGVDHWMSIPWGVGAALLGFLIGLILYTGRKNG